MAITQNIGIIPEAGHRGIDAREAFVTKQEAFQDHLTDTFVTEINTLGTQINNEMGTLNVAVATATTKANQASASATTASTKASEANVSANNALTYKNQIQAYVIPAGTSYSVDQINTQNSTMTKAQFNALAEERKANRAGSGFDEWGKHIVGLIYPKVNEGLFTGNNYSGFFRIGYNGASAIGTSKSEYPIVNINGVKQSLSGTNINTIGVGVVLPQAPTIYPYDTVLTPEQIASGVIKHADASNSGLIVNGKFDTDISGWNPYINSTITWDNGKLLVDITGVADGFSTNLSNIVVGKTYIIEFDVIAGTYTGDMNMTLGEGGNTVKYTPTTGRKSIKITASNTSTKLYSSRASAATGTLIIGNISVYPADAISRSDLVFLESFQEDISEKNFVYPLGNVQYLGAGTDGLTGIVNGSFTGFETYSLFGNWQVPSALIGRGYVWSSLSEAQKRAFVANPENNCYLDGDKVIQVRYRVRVAMGEDTNSMAKATVQGKAVVPSTVVFTAPVTTVDAGLYSNTSATYTYTGTSTNAISIALVQR